MRVHEEVEKRVPKTRSASPTSAWATVVVCSPFSVQKTPDSVPTLMDHLDTRKRALKTPSAAVVAQMEAALVIPGARMLGLGTLAQDNAFMTTKPLVGRVIVLPVTHLIASARIMIVREAHSMLLNV
jgi:hypothetical protein